MGIGKEWHGAGCGGSGVNARTDKCIQGVVFGVCHFGDSAPQRQPCHSISVISVMIRISLMVIDRSLPIRVVLHVACMQVMTKRMAGDLRKAGDVDIQTSGTVYQS